VPEIFFVDNSGLVHSTQYPVSSRGEHNKMIFVHLHVRITAYLQLTGNCRLPTEKL